MSSLICLRGSSPFLAGTSGRAWGCCRFCCCCFALQLALRDALHTQCQSMVRSHVLCLRPILHAPPAAGPAPFLSLALPLPPVTSAARAGPGRFPDPFGSFWGLGLLEQTSRSPFLRQLSHAQLYRPCSLLCGPGLCFGVSLFCQCSVLLLGGSPGKSQQWQLREWFGLRNTRSGQVGAGPPAPVLGAQTQSPPRVCGVLGHPKALGWAPALQGGLWWAPPAPFPPHNPT